MNDLQRQYPDASELLIEKLPASPYGECFRPEAQLLIEKYLSLKTEKSRNLYIANMIDHTKFRHEVSIFLKFRT